MGRTSLGGEDRVHRARAVRIAAEAVPFGPREAALAAGLYRTVPRARQRERDLGVAACALASGAGLWTLNARDFRDVPGLELFEA